MNIFTKFSPIAFVMLIAACAPVEQKPTITAPTEPEIIETAPITEAVIEEPVEAPVAEIITTPVETPIEETIEAPIEDSGDAPIDEVIEEPVETPLEVIAKVNEEPVAPPPPPPLPEPFDPVVLIGASPASLQATLGRHDHSFDNSGFSVRHYRQEACLMLVFVNQADEITHIDLRHGIVNQQVDIAACHQDLGARKDSVQ